MESTLLLLLRTPLLCVRDPLRYLWPSSSPLRPFWLRGGAGATAGVGVGDGEFGEVGGGEAVPEGVALEVVLGFVGSALLAEGGRGDDEKSQERAEVAEAHEVVDERSGETGGLRYDQSFTISKHGVRPSFMRIEP